MDGTISQIENITLTHEDTKEDYIQKVVARVMESFDVLVSSDKSPEQLKELCKCFGRVLPVVKSSIDAFNTGSVGTEPDTWP